MRSRSGFVVFALSLVVSLTMIDAPPAAAALLVTVTTTADVVDQNDGLTSLREAIDTASEAMEPVEISLPAATYTLTYCTPVGGEDPSNRRGVLELRGFQPLTIHGNGSTVDQTCASRHLSDLDTSGHVAIEHVTFTNGKGADAGSLYFRGGAVLDHVTVADTTVAGSLSAPAAVVLDEGPTVASFTDTSIVRTTGGGALHVTHRLPPTPTVSLLRTRLTDNANPNASLQGSPFTAGGVSSDLNLTIVDSEVSRNSGGFAGGVAAPFELVQITRSRVEDNTTTGRFGGVATAYAELADSSVSSNSGQVVGGIQAPSLEMVRTSVAANTSAFIGGFIGYGTIRDSSVVDNTGSAIVGGGAVPPRWNPQIPPLPDRVEVVNSTMAGNTGGLAGALFVETGKGAPNAIGITPLVLDRSTIAGNVGTGAGSPNEIGYKATEGPPFAQPGTITTSATVVGDRAGARPACDVSGQTVTSNGYNVAPDSSCGIGAGVGDRPAAGDVKLGPLAASGSSPLPVRTPRPDSVVRNQIPTGVAGCPGADQRGRSRPQQGRCDVGAVEAAGGGYHPLDTPHRAVDTRTPNTPLGSGEQRAFALTPAPGPAVVTPSWQAAVVNVTVTGVTAPTHLTLWADGDTKPLASNLNASPGQTIANHVAVPVSALNKIRVFNNAGTAHVILDVEGYFDDGDLSAHDGSECPCGNALTTLPAPARALDTRTTTPFGPGEERTLHVASTFGIPADATAIVANVTVTDATTASHLTLWPNGQTLPGVSNLNWPAGDTIANVGFIGLGTGGDIKIRNQSGTAQVIIDITGWFRGGPNGARFTATNPTRVLDTRNDNNPLTTGETRTFDATPSTTLTGATSIIANLTAVAPSAATHLTAWPTGQPLPPTSNLNVGAGDTRPNLTLTGLGNGNMNLRNNTGTTQVLLDLQGWFG